MTTAAFIRRRHHATTRGVSRGVRWWAAAALAVVASIPTTAQEAGWARFRGPNGAGIDDAAPLPREVGPTRNVIWKTALPPGHSSPVLTKDRVYVSAAENDRLLTFALDRATGKVLWRREVERRHSLPVDKRNVVYIHGTSSATFTDSYDRDIPSFDRLRAEHDKDRDNRFSVDEIPDVLAKRWMSLMDLNRDTYLDPDEWAYYQAARRSQGGLWAFRLGGQGDMTARSVLWHYNRSVPQLPSPLLYRGTLYIVNDGGIMTALNPTDGTMLAQRRLQGAVDSYYASPVGGDGNVFVVSESGTLTIIAADGALSPVSVNDLDDVAYATPAIADGRLYVRTRNTLYCFGLSNRLD